MSDYLKRTFEDRIKDFLNDTSDDGAREKMFAAEAESLGFRERRMRDRERGRR